MASVSRGKRRNIWYMKYRGTHGRIVYESSGLTDRHKAQRLANARETDVDRGAPIAVGKMTFRDAVALITDNYVTNKRRSLGELERRIRLHLDPYFGGWRMAEITTADVQAFMRTRLARRCSACQWTATDAIGERAVSCPECQAGTRPGAENAEVNRELAVLKRMFSLAVKGGRLLYQPHIPMLAEHNVRTGFFEREQLDALLAHLTEPVASVIRFAYLTGWRVAAEILTLEWRHIDVAGGVVRLDPPHKRRHADDPGQTKNRQGRVFPFDVLPELRELIAALQKRRTHLCPFVFHRDGHRVKSFRGEWDAAKREAGWPDKVPHDFRRTAVRNLVRASVPEKQAMLLTGHKTRAVFDRYDIVNEADLRLAVARYAGAGVSAAALRGRVLPGPGAARRPPSAKGARSGAR